MTSNENRPTRNQQREEARAKAKALREQQKKGERRKRIGLQVAIAAVVIAAVSIVWVAISSSSNSSNSASTPTNLIFDGGIKLGTGLEAFTSDFTPTPAPAASEGAATPPNIVVYIDYQCPICQAFEVPNSSQIKNWVNTGAATLEIHPLSFLDGRGTPNEYSSRAGNAAICVAEYAPNSFFDYNSILFENQPAEGTAGPSNDVLVEYLDKVQIPASEKLKSCIKNKDFGPWLLDHTSKVLSTPIAGTDQTVDGTPYILVNGQRYTWKTGEELMSPARFAQFVQAASTQQ
jgi:protein-disulfide isomerase